MLPKLELPSYTIKLPGSNQEIRYRPFTVKERSVLLVALQDGNIDNILGAISDIMKVCTFGVCELQKMSIVDAEFLFIQIRNKSVGEELDVTHTCECGKENDVRLNMELVSVSGSNVEKDIQLSDKMWIQMNYPTFKNSAVLSSEPTEDEVLAVIASCINTIISGEQVYKAQDSTVDELKEFILGLTQPQLDKIELFFASLPKVVIEDEYTCKCGIHNKLKIEGLENFFD